MKEKLRFLGLDVHAETIAVAVAEPEGEVRSLGTIPNRAESIRKLIKKLGPADKLRACYEAVPTGCRDRQRTLVSAALDPAVTSYADADRLLRTEPQVQLHESSRVEQSFKRLQVAPGPSSRFATGPRSPAARQKTFPLLRFPLCCLRRISEEKSGYEDRDLALRPDIQGFMKRCTPSSSDTDSAGRDDDSSRPPRRLEAAAGLYLHSSIHSMSVFSAIL